MGSKKNVSMTETEVKYKVLDEEAVEKVAETSNEEKSSDNGKKATASKKPRASRTKKAGQVEKTAEDTSTEKVEATPEAEAVETKKTSQKIIKKQAHSSKYRHARSQVDKTKLYDATTAIDLVKKLSYSNFVGTITAEGVMLEIGDKFEMTFPHSTGKAIRVAIVDDDLLKDIEAGKIDFDVLLTTPQFMPKLAKLARILGPKGLMPNPKNGTITPNPEARQKELEGGKTLIKTEKKAPLIHVNLGKTTDETITLVENLEALKKAASRRLTRLSISATMSPGVKVIVEK